MQRGISLVDLAKRLTENKASKADYVAPASRLKLEPQEDGGIGMVADDVRVPAIRPIAHDQIGGFLGIPSKYYDRCLGDDPKLLATNVNHWFAKYGGGERRMLRTLGGDLRGFLSDRYNRIEHEEIAEVVLPVLAEAGVEIRSCEITERRMYIAAVLPKVQAEVRKGDIVRAGVMVRNSEIGFGVAGVEPFAERLVCLNGMTMPAGKFSARHVGRRIGADEDLNAIFSDEARRADDRAVLLKMRDVVRHALDEARFTHAVDKMRALAEGRVTGDPARAVELLAAKVGANEDERGGILSALITGADLSAWGLLNAVTAQAHAASSYDRSVEFTEAGGRLLDLPKTEWKAILEAA